ncbi:MAG TPA: class I SAM-dependent methyltransferase [Acidimicrobiales bacterium]|jgi:SAM-dependent methyltransferase|nr:class I SAM-dependent methyltransferase [Acidimicrobiales bacterium]
MNRTHLEYLASSEWADRLQTDLLPWLASTIELGDDVLEIGPGPGLTTDLLRQRVAAVTAVELDADLAADLRVRLAGSNVEVIWGDGTELPLPDNRFSAATCFAMLHHVPSEAAQDQLFGELHRVLRPGGSFVATDSLDTERIRQAHIDDTYVPLDPATLESRLRAAGFANITLVQSGEYRERGDQIRVSALKP